MLLGLAALVALGSVEALTGTARTDGGGDRWQYRLRLSAPEPQVRIDPDHPEWGSVLQIPSFDRIPPQPRGAGRPAAEGQVPLPVKVLRVAIPDGAQVSLESIQASRRVLRGLRLGPVEARDAGASSAGAGPIAEPAAGETDSDAVVGPETDSGTHQSARTPAVRLGEVGWFRSQRFVEILYTPAVPGPSDATGARDVEFFPSVDASIVVTGVDWDAVDGNAAGAAHDPHFEASYEKAFVNYDEGKAYRSWAPTRRRSDATGFESSSASASSGRLHGAEPSYPATVPLPPAESIFAAATTPIYRVVVTQGGIFRLSHAYLLDPGTGVALGLAGANPNTFKLANMGVEVPIRTVTAVNGVFSSGDYIEFYGEGLTKEPKTLLNFDFDTIELAFPDIYQANDFTDENVYFLFAEPGPRARIPDLTGTVNGALPVVNSFAETIHREIDTRFVPNGVDDPFYQFPFLFDNNAPVIPDPNAANCGYVNPGAHTFTNHLGPGYTSTDPRYCPSCDLGLPDVISTGSPATVRVHMRGTSNPLNVNPDHLAIVQVGTSALQSTTFCFDAEQVSTMAVTVPQTSLLGTGDVVYVAQPGLSATTTRESLILDWIEADYLRALRLSGNELEADFTNVARTYDVGGFPTNTVANIIVYDISAAVGGSAVRSPRRVTGGSISGGGGNFTYSFSLAADGSLPGGARRVFAAAGAGAFRVPVRVEQVTGEDLTLATHAADMIVITAGGNVDTTSGSDFMDYLTHRETDSGLTIKVVTMRDVYDHFSDGIETPQAIRTFLAYAFNFWTGPSGTSPPAAYVMLVGDTTVDYKNILQIPDWINQVPTYIMYNEGFVLDYYSADTYLASFRGADQVPDVHIGRISARDIAQSETIFRKMLDYDLNPPDGAWRTHAIFIADKGKTLAETAEFEEIQTDTASTYFASGGLTHDKLYYQSPEYANGNDPNALHDAYIDLANEGAALTSFLGHGSFQVWGLDNFFFSDDVALLVPNQKPTFLVNENCLAGGFHALSPMTLPFDPMDALGEAFQRAEDTGAVAVFAPAGLSFSLVSYTINASLYGDMFGLHKERRFGHLMTNIKLVLPLPSLTDRHAYTLLGDPAQRFILPGARPPVGFAAQGGLDEHVLLTWSPSPDANVRTRIYRSVHPAGLYSMIATGLTGTSFDDMGVINGTRYYYRALSVDPNGMFEGGVTNTNADCNIQDPANNGPQCIAAVPINPDPPPVPTGLLVSNPGQGDRLSVAWDMPPDPDVDYHTIHYGTTEGGPYPFAQNVDFPVTDVFVTGLTTGTPYFLRLTATNTSGRTSAPTGEVRGTPALFEGVNPPAFIDDLRVFRSSSQPSSIELRWTPPVLDVYGGVTTPVQFDVYRSTVPLFQPNATNRIMTIPDEDANGWIDPGAYATPTTYFYLVTVTDANGLVSGAGRQLPKGIDDLELDHVGPNVTMSWTPVFTDIDGGSTFIDHYVVYSGTMPLAREIIDPMTPLAPHVTTPSFSAPVPLGELIYFTVIVVDRFGNRSPF